MVAIGYQPPQRVDSIANAIDPNQQAVTTPEQPSVDQLVATNIAAGIAERAELPIASNVANLSVSLSAESELSQGSNNIVSKPQIVQPTADGREMRDYTAKAGDTIQSIAEEFGVSPETIRWANSLNSDAVEEGKHLRVPPVDGVVYVVREGDTLESIAGKYQADQSRIVAFNDLELSGITPGKSLVLPGGVLPENERPGYVAPRRGTTQGVYGGNYSAVNSQIARASAGNRYAYGNCTWYAYERRAQLGRPVGSFWGNAATWSMYARSAGYLVNNTPAVGAVMQNGGGYGHVAIVEKLNSDGSITISEMNYAGNFNRVTSRTVDGGTAAGFTYIH
jgi:surface antigen